jgi:glycosyltransferase involved in cell wall biosynthesis
MLREDIRFHLQPISERHKLDELQQREQTFLSGSNCHTFKLPPPRSGLRLVIVIPALNEEVVIGRALRCLYAQSLPYDQFEVIVVDNGSTDGTQSAVLNFTRHCDLPIHLISEPFKGCLRAVRTGMDVALHRLAQASFPQEGIIATIDADDQVGLHWAVAVVENITERKADMIRGPTQVAQSLPLKVELCIKALCDVENHVNAYAELARLRLEEALYGINRPRHPLWLPRITGPNIAITRAAYIAVGGLDPRPPGDQASHLANPLLRMGGVIALGDDPRMTLFRSCRCSLRNFDEAGGFGAGFGMGFGDILSRAIESVKKGTEIDYPNPGRVETGLRQVLAGLQTRVREKREEVKEIATRFLDAPPDPSELYRYGSSSEEPVRVSLGEAKATLIGMTARAGGMDYRVAERFLMARELLRSQVLSFDGQWVQSDRIVDAMLNRMGFSSAEMPSHLRQMATALKSIPNAGKEKWYDEACCKLEELYARIKLS